MNVPMNLFMPSALGQGTNIIYGTPGDDTINGTAADDNINGKSGNDLLQGAAGDDFLWGEHDSDTLNGGAGNDTLNGGPGNDLLQGGAGDDFLTGGTGRDTVNGGLGKDFCNFGHGDTPQDPDGAYWNESIDAHREHGSLGYEIHTDFRPVHASADGKFHIDVFASTDAIDLSLSEFHMDGRHLIENATGKDGQHVDIDLVFNHGDIVDITDGAGHTVEFEVG